MKCRTVVWLSFFALVSFAAMSCTKYGTGHEAAGAPDEYRAVALKDGAQLYDNWPKIKKASLKENHPLYPSGGKAKGSSTWRCKECHGWDYIGKDGRYSKGSHYTGIKGIYDARSKSPGDLLEVLTDRGANHDFSDHLSTQDIWSITKFIREGLIDFDSVIHADGSAKGSPERGGALFAQHCVDCHGQDGTGIDFREEEEGVHGVGWEARGNPQETVHKIRWGHPGSDMPSMIADANLSEKDVVDILAFCQTLP